MNLSNEINSFIQNYEYPNFKQIKFGDVINDLVVGYNLSEASEEECVDAFEDMKEIWLEQDYIRETTSISTLESVCKREAKTIKDIQKIISEEFEIFEVTVEEHAKYNHRFEIRYYRNPDYCETRHYIEVTVLTKEDLKTIKKILNIRKDVKW